MKSNIAGFTSGCIVKYTGCVITNSTLNIAFENFSNLTGLIGYTI